MNDYIQECKYIGKNLKYLRNLRGLSLAKLSRELGVPRGTLGYLECGYSKPSEERQKLIANFYGIADKDDLFMNHNAFIKKHGSK